MSEPAGSGRWDVCRSEGVDRSKRSVGVPARRWPGYLLRFWLSSAGGGAARGGAEIGEEEVLQMKAVVISSDQLHDWSDRLDFIRNIGAAQATSGVATAASFSQINLARLGHRAIQTLRQVGLQLHARTRAWSEVLLVCQSFWHAPGDGVRAVGVSGAGNLARRQLSTRASNARRDLRDQSRTLATTRGARIERHGVTSQRGCRGRCYSGNQHGSVATGVRGGTSGTVFGQLRSESYGAAQRLRWAQGRS